jgi:acyl carrier protein phosphodiesterase
MNYLAHLFLAQPVIESRVGNLLGDFSKGVEITSLPVAIQLGVENHRFVDRFTDTHPEIQQLKTLISPQRRRFAGIMLDMLFDHFLILHWPRFSSLSFQHSCSDYYADLASGQSLMPLQMQRVTCRIIEQDWFSSYAELEGIGFALDRIADRIRFANEFADSIVEIKCHETEMEAGFLRFFPELMTAVENQNIEQRPLA